MTVALLVKADGEVAYINLPQDDAHIMIHHKVGGWFDVVRHPTRNFHGYVHDEGLFLDMRPNVACSYLFGQLIVGDVVISGTTENGEEADFCADDETIALYKQLNTDEEYVGRLEEIKTSLWSQVGGKP